MKGLKMLAAVAAAVSAVACVQEEISAPQTHTVVYSASLAGDVSRAEMGLNEDGRPQSLWTDGDKITIHNGARGFEFATSLDAPSEDADFTYVGNDFTARDGVMAIYPAGEYAVDLSGKTVTAAIPSLQHAVAGSYDPDAAIAVAYSENKSLTFRNVTAMLKFIVKDSGVKNVVLKGLDGEAIQNVIAAKMTEDGSAIESVSASGEESSVTLSAESFFTPGETYYLAVAPQVLEKGFAVYFQLSAGGTMYLAKAYEKACTFKRNVILNIGELACNLPELGDEKPMLNSFKFTVEDNPGKILSRKFSHNSSFTVTTSSVSEEVCTVDQASRKVSHYIPYLNNRKLVPTFEISKGAVLLDRDGKVIISGETEVDFLRNTQLTVVNGKDETAVYDVELTNTGIPVVVINQISGTTSTEDDSEYQKASAAWFKATGTKWQPKDADWSMEEGDNFMVYNADGTSALADKNGAVVDSPALSSTRLRGNVTQQMPKKSFAIKLDKKHGMLDMPAHKRWVLLANWKDRTLMRNEVAFGIADVFKQTFPDDGMAWNPSGQHVELVYNGVYVGNYYLCEQVKVDGNRLDINDPYDVEDGYSGNPEDYGYLLEADDGYDETWKFTTACYIPFLFKDDANDAMLEYAQNFVRGIEDKLYAGSYETALENMDLSSFVDYWLIQELMMNSETAHPKSCYNYINEGKMYAGPLWDFDWNTLPASASYSENGYSYSESMLEDAVPTSGWFGSKTYQCFHKSSGYPAEPLEESDANYLWYPMLVKSADFKSLAAERWNAVKGAISTYVDNEIPKVQTAIAKSESENSKMWPVDSGSSSWSSQRKTSYGIGGGFCGDEGKSFSEAVSTMQATLKTRISGMSFVSDKSWPDVTYGSK